MSEESEKVAGIKNLPIFPLPLVLLPHELLPLHIFEDRYRQMLSDVTAAGNIFGITRFEPGDPLEKMPAPGSIGCAAEIRESQKLEDGRANILTVGIIRFRLKNYLDLGEPYLVAEVEFFEDVLEDEMALGALADEVFALFRRVAKAAHKLSGREGDFPEIPQAEPQQLSFLVSAAFNLDNEIKYSLLEMETTSERLLKLKDILSQAVDQVEESAKINKVSRTNGHVDKKINID